MTENGGKLTTMPTKEDVKKNILRVISSESKLTVGQMAIRVRATEGAVIEIIDELVKEGKMKPLSFQ